jgi:4-hydroxybenzoate polyprenyltransferase
LVTKPEQEPIRVTAFTSTTFSQWKQRLGPYLALSRTPHGLIDMAAPALAALLCLGYFPPPAVVLVGLATMFAGYTAVYALNDLVDLRIDRAKVGIGGYSDAESYVDGVLVRHPLAKNVLSFNAGLAWTAAWTLVTLAGAWWLNPVCLYLFLAGCLLEAIYCKLLRISPWRALINGIVKTIGPLAAVFAVQPQPSLLFLAILFMWFFCWEIGGQNIPNDWTDIEEDRHFGAKTIPVRLGLRRAAILSLVLLVAAFFLHPLLLWVSPLSVGGLDLAAAAAVAVWLLLRPALRLAQESERRSAMALFNQASFYPLASLGIVLFRLALS